MSIMWKYLDKRSATIAALKDYDSMKFIIDSTGEEVRGNYESMAGVGGMKYDGMPKGHNPKAGEDRILNGLEAIDILRERYRQATEFMNWFQPAWEQLTEDERMVLDRAFSICSSLTSITIPDSVSDVEANPFLECEKLKQINISPDHPYLALIDGVLFSKSDKRLVCYPYTLTKESYAIPNGILLIGDCAFCNCKFLTSITIPDSVTSIGVSAFCNCILLGSVAIPNSVTSIGSCAFSLCKSITSITIPNSVTSIENYTFYESSITSIEIPDSVTSIGESVFSNCLSLISVTIPDSVTSIGIGAFFDCPNLTVTVPRDSFAKQYCIDNGIPYTYPDALDWLNN